MPRLIIDTFYQYTESGTSSFSEGCPTNWKALGISAAVYAAKGNHSIFNNGITADHNGGSVSPYIVPMKNLPHHNMRPFTKPVPHYVVPMKNLSHHDMRTFAKILRPFLSSRNEITVTTQRCFHIRCTTNGRRHWVLMNRTAWSNGMPARCSNIVFRDTRWWKLDIITTLYSSKDLQVKNSVTQSLGPFHAGKFISQVVFKSQRLKENFPVKTVHFRKFIAFESHFRKIEHVLFCERDFRKR